MKCNVNEIGESAAYRKLDFKLMVAMRTKKSKVIEGIFCQTRSGVRSILNVCEELRYCRLVKNTPIRMIFLF